MSGLISKNKFHWSDRSFYISTIWAGALLVVAVILNTMANEYAALTGKNPVTDVVLNNVRVFNVDLLVNYGPIFIACIVIVILFLHPSGIPFTVKSLALFILIRAGFISLTHLGQFEPQLLVPTTGIVSFFGGGNSGGLFFSGHTGIPFLLAIIFKSKKLLSAIFVGLSIVLGAAMLLAHLHYTIDVIAAFFITPTIYHIARKFFKKDYRLFLSGLD